MKESTGGFGGDHFLSSAICVRSCWMACLEGCPPPTFSTCSAIHPFSKSNFMVLLTFKKAWTSSWLFRERVPLRPDNHQSGVFILTTRRAENNRFAQRNTQAVPLPPPHPRLVIFSSADGRFASRSTNSVSRQEFSNKQSELCRSALSRIFSA